MFYANKKCLKLLHNEKQEFIILLWLQKKIEKIDVKNIGK